MPNELQNLVWSEKWRPTSFKELIISTDIEKYLKNPMSIPSFLFVSNSPGCGKTTCANLIADYLKCDMLKINSSMDRGIDVIREKVKIFSQSMSSETGVKRLVFMDEADGLTPASQTSLRNVIEEYSDNVFFIFTANDISKIIEPIRSRCITISFDSPNKVDILLRLEDICEKENLNYTEEIIEKLVNLYYPDIRSMILSLQKCSIEGNFTQLIEDVEFGTFLTAIKKKDIKYLYQKTYDGSFNLLVFNKWFFKYLYDNSNLFSFKQLSEISRLLAETEKAWNLGANLPIIFLSNILQISSILS